MIVTKAHLEALRQGRALPPVAPSLTPDSALAVPVQMHVDRQRMLTIAHGENVLSFAQSKLRLALNKARKEGWTHQHFNRRVHTPEFKP